MVFFGCSGVGKFAGCGTFFNCKFFRQRGFVSFEKASKYFFPALLVFVTCFFYYPGEYWASHWFSRWGFTCIALSAAIGWQFRKLHWSLVVPVALSLATAIWPLAMVPMQFAWRGIVFSGIPTVYQLDQVAQGAYTALAFVLVVVYAYNLSSGDLDRLWECFGWFCLVTSLVVVGETIRDQSRPVVDVGRQYMLRGAYIGNPSMCACLLAATIPAFRKLKLWPIVWIFPLIAILATHSSQAIGVLGLCVTAGCFCKSKCMGKYTLAIIFAFWGLLGLFGVLLNGTEFFSSTGRTYMWVLAWDHWSTSSPYVIWLGLGNGTMALHFPQWQNILRQGAIPTKTFDWFFWLHSDLLQVLVEQGIIGAIFWANLFYWACVESYKKSASLFASVVAYGSMTIFNFPAHLPAHALFGALLTAMAFKKETQNERCIE